MRGASRRGGRLRSMPAVDRTFAGFVPDAKRGRFAPERARHSFSSRLEVVAPVRTVRLAADERRREHADEAQVALHRAQDVLVVAVERVDGAGPDREGPPRRDLHHLALAGNAVVGLEMVLVTQLLLGTFR